MIKKIKKYLRDTKQCCIIATFFTAVDRNPANGSFKWVIMYCNCAIIVLVLLTAWFMSKNKSNMCVTTYTRRLANLKWFFFSRHSVLKRKQQREKYLFESTTFVCVNAPVYQTSWTESALRKSVTLLSLDVSIPVEKLDVRLDIVRRVDPRNRNRSVFGRVYAVFSIYIVVVFSGIFLDFLRFFFFFF